MYQTGYHATGYHATGYYLRGVLGAVVVAGAVWMAHATQHLWSAARAGTTWESVCATFNWKADDDC